MIYKKLLLFLIFLAVLINSYAQTGTTFEITNSSIDAGGGKSNSTNYNINSSIGLSSASNKISGSTFSIKGGFWASKPRPDNLFSNGFEN